MNLTIAFRASGHRHPAGGLGPTTADKAFKVRETGLHDRAAGTRPPPDPDNQYSNPISGFDDQLFTFA